MKFIAHQLPFFCRQSLALCRGTAHGPAPSRTSGSAGLFFIWASVFNLFVVSVFWALMVDVFDADQSKRLFGFIAAAATLGGIFGSSVTAALAKQVPPIYLLLASALLLELAVFCVRPSLTFVRALSRAADGGRGEAPIGGSMLAGLAHAFNSPYPDQRQFISFAVRDHIDVFVFPAGRYRQANASPTAARARRFSPTSICG